MLHIKVDVTLRGPSAKVPEPFLVIGPGALKVKVELSDQIGVVSNLPDFF
jgi:hypothetical protein